MVSAIKRARSLPRSPERPIEPIPNAIARTCLHVAEAAYNHVAATRFGCREERRTRIVNAHDKDSWATASIWWASRLAG